MTINILIFFVGLFIGSGIGIFIASLSSIGKDADLIDMIQNQRQHIRAQEIRIRELARRLQDAQATQL
jgi:hypothetical protein